MGKMIRPLVLLLLMLAAVASAQSPADSLLQPRKEHLTTFERSFKPSFYDTEVYLYRKTDSTRTNGRAIDQWNSAAPETLQGFRVQLLATTNYDEVGVIRAQLAQQFPDLWVYLVFEAPIYKIRVGDFSNRPEAKSLMDKLSAQGYKKAWIVPDRIIRNQPPKPPLPAAIDSLSVPRASLPGDLH